MTNHRVLIANHDAVTANRCGTLLESFGYVVTLAFTSDEAIRLAAEAQPALLIVDPVMPGLSGFEAAAHIARRVGCRVLFLTNLAGDADFVEMLAGMVQDGIHCAAFPVNVSNADLITFVHSELGPVVLVPGAGKDKPRKEATPAAEDIDLAGGFVPIENNDDVEFKPRGDPYTPLFTIANCNLYQTNAFRVTGLQVTATARDTRRAHQELNRSKELGREWVPACFIRHIVDPSDDERETAFTQIDDPEQRLLQEFFWFWADGDADDAFAAVQANDQDRALKEWRRRNEAGDPEGVASHNLAVFNHLMALQCEGSKLFGQPVVASDFWREAFHYWHAVIENSRFWGRFIRHIQHVNDPRVTPALAEKIWASLPEAILYINAANAVRAAEAGEFAEAARQRQLMNGAGLGKQNADKALSRALRFPKSIRPRVLLQLRQRARRLS
jgi:CheY-like chemotaxis protein